METDFALYLYTVAFLSVCVQCINYEYTTVQVRPTTVQVRPITFATNLESQVLFTGDDLALICNVSLSNDLPILLRWRRQNNEFLNSENFSEIHHEGMIVSELKIENISVSDDGVYECLVWDGDETAPFVTVTNSAQITVIDHVSSYSHHDVIDIVKSIGEYILLPCNITKMVKEVIWEKNEQCYPATFVLKSGDLIIHNLTEKDEGTYRCFANISKSFFYGEVYNLSLSANETSVHPRVLIDPVDVLLTGNENTSISCCLLGVYDSDLPYELTWFRKNISGNFIVSRTNLTEYCNQLRIPLEILEPGFYEYMCGIVIKTTAVAYNSSIMKLQIQDIPIIDATLRITDMLLISTLNMVNLKCPLLLSGSNLTYKWYRNGVYLSDSTICNKSYEYVTSVTDNVVGIYQCFVENSVGSDYAIIRVLDAGFANPPENFTCIARNQSFVLQWNLPNFNTTLIDKYVVIYEKEEYETADTFYQIPFESDKLYVDFQVYVKSQNRVLIDGIPNCCQILSSLERVTSSDSVKDITLNCPTSMSSGNFSLENPSISRDYSKQQILSAELERYHLLCKCLHKNVINECGDHSDSTDSRFDESIFTFDIEKQPSNSLCLIGGMYHFMAMSTSPLFIPPKTCKILASSSKLAESPLLNVSCEGKLASIFINEPLPVDFLNISFQVDGHCLLSDITTINVSYMLSYTNTEIMINHTFPEILVCSFVAYYHNNLRNSTQFEYLQCVMDKYVSVTVELVTTTTTATTTATATTTTTATKVITTVITTVITKKKSVLYMLVQTLVGLMLIVSISLLLILLVCLGRKQQFTSDNEVWQKAVETVSEEIEQKEIVENSGENVSKEDTLSVITIFEQLQHSSKENNRFLCHQLEKNEKLWSTFIRNSFEKPLYYLNRSNSSGYETESENVEYFVTDD